MTAKETVGGARDGWWPSCRRHKGGHRSATADDDWDDEIDSRYARRHSGNEGSGTNGGASKNTSNEPPRAEDVDDEQRVLFHVIPYAAVPHTCTHYSILTFLYGLGVAMHLVAASSAQKPRKYI